LNETPNLDIAAARYVLGTATPEEIEALSGSVSGQVTAASLDALGVPLPSNDQAAWTLLELHISAIAHGRVEPEEGLRFVIEEVFRPAGLSRRSRYRLGDSHGIDRLVALQDVYDDMRRSERRSNTPDRRQTQVDAQLILAAMEWMAANAS